MKIEADSDDSREGLREGSPLSVTKKKRIMSTAGDPITVPPQPAHRHVKGPDGQVTTRHTIDTQELGPGYTILKEAPQPPSLPTVSADEQPALATIYGPNGVTRKVHGVDAREICERPDSVWSLTPEGVQE